MIRFMNVSTAATITYSLPNKRLIDSISVIEVFVDKKFNNTNYFGVDGVANLYTDWNYMFNSKTYFELDNDNRLYLNDDAHSSLIITLQLWDHNQFLSAGGICIPTQNNFITFGIQDEHQTEWIDIDITSDYNLTLFNNLCSYNCDEGYFGPRWEDRDTYMSRSGKLTQTYYKKTYEISNKIRTLDYGTPIF